MVGFSLIREVMFNWPPSWLGPRVDAHREWYRSAKERNLAKLRLAKPSTDYRDQYGLFELDDIKKNVRKSHLADQRFWRTANLLGYAGGTLRRFPDVAIKRPIPWILAITYACWSHRTEIPWCKIGNLTRDVWSDPRSLLSIAIPALALIAIVYALFFRNQLGHAQARTPTIVRPWQERIDAATTPSEAVRVLEELCSFTVLDPTFMRNFGVSRDTGACKGSGSHALSETAA